SKQKPTTGKQMMAALGLFNFFRDFIPRYSELAAPLEEVKNKSKIVWNTILQDSWEKLIFCLENAPVLHFLDTNYQIAMACDASDNGRASVIFQDKKIEDKIWRH